ncbi:hypothetical protein PCK2_000137 [Pneumocystis canis]|nr:hypothetical protein PCK2_000137 [Pneumocystis canis]
MLDFNITVFLLFVENISSLILLISMMSYFLLYWYLIPSIEINQPIYLQYGNNPVWGFLDLSSERRFVDKQSYNILLELLVPLSESNIHIGNFMANIELFSETGVLMNSSRPAMLTFSSLLLTKLRTLILLPIFLLGFMKEEEKLIIPLVEGFKYHKGHQRMLKSVNITLSHHVQVYSSKLIFSAQLQGIKYMIYYHPICSFILFAILCWIILWFTMISCYFSGEKMNFKKQREFSFKNEDFSHSEKTPLLSSLDIMNQSIHSDT